MESTVHNAREVGGSTESDYLVFYRYDFVYFSQYYIKVNTQRPQCHSHDGENETPMLTVMWRDLVFYSYKKLRRRDQKWTMGWYCTCPIT